ncbi:small conductance mechanosensitive channel [Methylohalomonas lacus]|uniref:Small conductance mechanosensitive channel n=1 Tax=Methylohalomonas lacus TaxID=398773 RepID=A0AAE3HIQ0_9GAMM|nr:mechanosensitive ion channel domain-containing protein [Methylohalomonas lacus]MCS3903081.1 small conductance mechanosensitive channel [Methylohalomonas lacus]
MVNPLAVLLLFFNVTFAGTVVAQSDEATAGAGDKASYATLAELLENDEARERLIDELRQLSAETEPANDAGQSPAIETVTAAEPSFARKIANNTQTFAEEMIAKFRDGSAALVAVTSSDDAVDWSAAATGALNLVLVIVATVALYFILRRLARSLFSLANRWALKQPDGRQTLLRRGAAVLASAIVDFLVIVLAWVGGYLFALFVLGDSGSMDTRESLFLNAFLVVELFKALLRIIFASRDEGLRLLPMSAETAAYWNAWLARLSGFIGYGIMLVVPMINALLSVALGQMVSTLIMLMALAYALVVILQNRVSVKEQLQVQARTASFTFSRVSLGMLARSWHVLAILYFVTLVVAMMVRPEDALPLMLKATAQTLLAIAVGIFLTLLMGQGIGQPLRVPEQTRLRFPQLEQRLNAFIPTTLKVVRVVILVAVIAVVMDAWGLFSLTAWLASEAGTHVIGTALTVAIILLVAMLIWIGLASWIEHRLNPDSGRGEPTAREKTLLTIFRNAVAIAMIIMTLMIVLAEIGINIGPLLAGAGVLGLAIGFGAQKLVQDIITGVFIQMENAINAGDVVTAGGITGTAEKLTIRSLGIRDLSGTYHLIPFSSVDSVSNYMRDFAYHVGEYGVAYREDTDEVIVKLREAFAELVADPAQRENVIGDLEVHGVTALADNSVNIRVRIKTLPGVQWAVGREYNRLVKRHLDAAGIEIPFPHMTLYFGEDKDGSAPVAPIRLTEAPARLGADQSGQAGAAKANPQARGDFDEADAEQ